MSVSPFFDTFGAEGLGPDTNKNFIEALAWSPDGLRLAFLIVPPSGTDNQNAGIWWYSPGVGDAYAALWDCPIDGYTSCLNTTGTNAGHWQSLRMEFAPNGNQLLVTVRLPDENRQAFAVVDATTRANAQISPLFVRHDTAYWLNNNELLVSGAAPDGRVYIGRYSLTSNQITQVIYDGSANGLWLQDAVQAANGQIFALGNPGSYGGAQRLYRIANGQATPISGFIGDRAPERITWTADRSQVVLTIGAQQFVVNAFSGSVQLQNTGGTVNVGGQSSDDGGIAPIGQRDAEVGETVIDVPPGVIVGNRYVAGQQIRNTSGIRRNLRAQPVLASSTIGGIDPDQFVTILAGPFETGGFEWWRVSNEVNQQGWVATQPIGGNSFFGP